MMHLRKGAALRRPWLFSLGGYYYAVRANRIRASLYSPEKVKNHEEKVSLAKQTIESHVALEEKELRK